MIHVLAIITAKPGMRDAILKEFRANMPAVHAENGCIEYGPATDAEGMGGFQTKFGDDTFVADREMGEYRRTEGARRCAPYGGLWREDARDDRESRDPCPVASLSHDSHCNSSGRQLFHRTS